MGIAIEVLQVSYTGDIDVTYMLLPRMGNIRINKWSASKVADWCTSHPEQPVKTTMSPTQAMLLLSLALSPFVMFLYISLKATFKSLAVVGSRLSSSSPSSSWATC